ncbi:E3 ubiquitin-protein ligase listerin-like isoform X1 [Acipenser ruthenus]|uniref:E3 ubiquitin-protein ligase listerin-like isoform X1 n=1 Tax=Acipenser ruthenus TaxID=7906 RepID=UPI002741FA64|nr:E3 ubiquitin-protein ligase listerin-like isoform X1 [Acipenser ruthenus]
MGGKNKQRTKGNVRPSSSGRAAELLARERGAVPGFVGFGSSSNDLGYVPAVYGAEEIDNLVDADFRMVLRKLSKRDTITKLKAVQEFGTMCKERESEIVKGVLPYWPRIYCKISMDHDRRVREATEQAFEQLILKVKRNLAPYLKSIMGYWLIAQCDTYSPAASAANVAFQAAFPTSKQPEALAFCKEEILNILQDNLLKETPDTLSDPQSVPEEEREAKYVRVVTCSLLALKKLLTFLPGPEIDTLEENLTQLLSQNKFWKYSKHTTPQIRGALFEAVATFCQHTPELIQTQATRACSAVLLNIDDTDPVVCPALWEAVLYILTNIKDCWQHVNSKKGVMPKLWLLLKEGGRGLATVLHPNLLPFISKLPDEITDPKLEFYNTFFSSVILGLSSERAVSSPSECSAIIFAFMECLRFSLLQNAGAEDEHKKVQQMLISDQLLLLVESALKNPRLQSSPLFYQITDMLVSWEKRVNPSSEGTAEDTFQRLLSDFWDGVTRLCVQQVDRTDAEENALNGVSTLLQVMQSPEGSWKQCKKKAIKIRFAGLEGAEVKDDDDEEDLPTVSKSPSNSTLLVERSDPGSERPHSQNRRLEDLVCELAELNMVYVNEQRSDKHLKFLSVLVSSFPSRRLFQVLLDSDAQNQETGLGETSLQEKTMAANPAVQFLLQKLIIWLKEDQRKDTDFLVNMLYSVLHCCDSNEEKKLILDHISKMDLKWSILLQIIQKACADEAKFEATSDWLKGEVLGEKLVKLAEDLCAIGLNRISTLKSSHSDSWALISLALSQHVQKKTLIGEVYVEKIIEKLHATLLKAKNLSDAGDIEPLVSFICDVASNFFCSVKNCLLLSSAEDLLLTVFQLCAQSQEITHLSDSLLQKLNHACFAGIQSLVGQIGTDFGEGTFLHSSALWVKNQILNSTMGVKSLQVLISSVCSLMENLIRTNPPSSHIMEKFIECLTPNDSEWKMMRQALPPQWLKRPLLNGRLNLNCQYLCMDVWRFRSSVKIPSHLCAAALLGQVILIMLESINEKDKLNLVGAECTVAEVLYSLQWCEEIEILPAVVSELWCQEMNITHERISKESGKLFNVLETLFSRSMQNGSLWTLTLAKYTETKEVSSSDLKKLYETIESFFPLTEQNLCTIQGLSPFLFKEEKELLMNYCTAELLKWEDTDITSIHGGYGYLAVIHCCLKSGATGGQDMLMEVLRTVMEWRNHKEDVFLFNFNLKEVSPSLLVFNVQMIRFICWLIRRSPSFMTDSQWDFILCSMLAWLETVSENTGSYWNPWAQVFACQTCNLVTALSEFFTAPAPDLLEKLPANLMSEWKEFFTEGVHSLLLPLFVKITGEPEQFSETDDPLFPLPVLKAVGDALIYIPVEQLTQNNLQPKFAAGQKTNLPDKLQTLLNTLTPLLLFKARHVQISVYYILHKVMPQLPEFDNENDNTKSDDEEEEEPCLSPPAALMAILGATEELLDNILGSVQVGEFAVVQPLSEEYCCILGYLLTWKLILTFFKASSSHLRVQYSLYLRKTKSLHKLLFHLFRLMPDNPVYPGQTAEPGSKETRTFFTEDLHLSALKTEYLPSEIAHLACSVYYITLKDLPAMVRLWWNGQEKRVFNTVDKFTSKYVSNVLSCQEISSVQTSTQTFENMTVKARSTTREVIATYSVEDIFIELVIQLPQNYPLGSISVESGRRVGVAVQQWRNWMLQLSTYLTHQNGSIMEGLALWKNNVDKRFEGVEDCMICYSVIHGSNYSLPKKACRTCKKKFHSACLYKWFTSSNKSTCPLCRETFF